MTDWNEILWKMAKVGFAGGVGAVVAYLASLPAEPTVIVTIAGFKALQEYLRQNGWNIP